MTTYLLYAKGGQEMQVAEDLRLAGIDTWCGRVLKGERPRKRGTVKGKRAAYVWTEEPALPNYLFATMSADQFHAVFRAGNPAWRHLAGTSCAVGRAGQRELQQFQRQCDDAYKEAKRAKERGETPPPQFAPGQLLEINAPHLSNMFDRFRRLVETPDGIAVEVDSPLGPVRVRPEWVKAAE